MSISKSETHVSISLQAKALICIRPTVLWVASRKWDKAELQRKCAAAWPRHSLRGRLSPFRTHGSYQAVLGEQHEERAPRPTANAGFRLSLYLTWRLQQQPSVSQQTTVKTELPTVKNEVSYSPLVEKQ